MRYINNFKINFDKLPHKGSVLNWSKMTGEKVYFTYNDNEKDYFVITHIEPINNNTSKLMIYTDYHGFNSSITQSSFRKSKLSAITQKIEFGYRYKIGDIIDNRIEIIDRKRVKRGINFYNRYKYRCKVCGNIDWTVESTIVNRKFICNVCCGRKTLENYNDIPTTDPWMIPYFQGGIEEARQYMKSSNKKVIFKCPDCGRIKNKPLPINQLDQRKSINCVCGDGISYPNKYMYKALEQTGLEFINEYSPDWIKPKRYDFYIPSKNLIVEIDGGLGHGKRIHKKAKITLEETLERDKFKDIKAIEHNLNIIRIDIEVFEYKIFKNKIIESKIFSQEELNSINFDECENFACSNLVKYVCEQYEKLKPITTYELADKLKIPQSTIHGYLVKGAELSMCSYKTNVHSKNKKYKLVCFDKNMNYIKTYKSVSEAEKAIGVHGVSACCSGKQKTAGGYIWRYIE